MNSFKWSVLSLVLLLEGGCSGGGKQSLSGKVTLDGEAVAEGKIDFIPSDGKSTTASGLIKDGRYEATVPVGTYRVEIRASKIVGKRKLYNTPDSPTVDKIEERIPEKFNKQSKLIREIDGKSSEVDFELKTKE